MAARADVGSVAHAVGLRALAVEASVAPLACLFMGLVEGMGMIRCEGTGRRAEPGQGKRVEAGDGHWLPGVCRGASLCDYGREAFVQSRFVIAGGRARPAVLQAVRLPAGRHPGPPADRRVGAGRTRMGSRLLEFGLGGAPRNDARDALGHPALRVAGELPETHRR